MRNANDYYPTPHWCFEKLNIDFSKYATALEPCAGDGRIVSFLEHKGIETDYCEISEGIDFLKHPVSKVDLVLTNPPFSLAMEFIEKSMLHADTVIMLLRLNFLGSQKRNPWWQTHKPKKIIVLSKRPSFTGTGTDSTEYAWFIWEKNTNYIEPGIDFIL